MAQSTPSIMFWNLQCRLTFFSMILLSSAYVCGEDAGFIQEKPFRLGKPKKGTGMIDIDIEKKLVEEKLRKLHSEHAEESAVTSYMKDYGTER